MKIILFLTLVFLISLNCWGYMKHNSQNISPPLQSKWKKYKNLEELWSHVKNEKIESISICDEDPDADIDSWYVFAKYPEDQLQDLIIFMNEEIESDSEQTPGHYEQSTCQESLKIVTDKGIYVAPFVERAIHGDWTERVSLVGLWPRLQKEKIISISFCNDNPEVDIDSWDCLNIPKVKLDECLGIIDIAVKKADSNHFQKSPSDRGRMKIVTDKGKYLVRAEVSTEKVFGNEWSSGELGQFIVKYCYPGKEINFQYEFPAREQVVSVLLYSLRASPPLALFGDKILTEEIIFNPQAKEEPNGLKGVAGLHKAARLGKFGIEIKKEKGKSIDVNEIKPNKLYEGPEWLEKIMIAYEVALKQAEQREKYFPMKLDTPVIRIVFMTRDKDYWKEFGIDANTVYDDYIKSEQLKQYFDELGLTQELLAAKP